MAERIVRVKVQDRPAEERELLVPVGTGVMALLGRKDMAGRWIMGAVVNNRLVSLASPVRSPARIRPITQADLEGVIIYRRSIALLLALACQELYPAARLRVGQSLGEGYFFEWESAEALTPETVRALETRMRAIVEEDRPFAIDPVDIEEAIDLFDREGAMERVRLLRTLRTPVVSIVAIGARHALLHGPVAVATGGLGGFELAQYDDGLILRFPDPSVKQREIADMPRLFKVYRDTRCWNEILGVGDVGQFNTLCIQGHVDEIVKVSEGLHEKRIAEIADQIIARPSVRLVLIAGPSSSGKTTFAKRLSIQLRVAGRRPVALSLDDYYLDRARTQLDEEGNPDFEAIEAIDLALLNEHLPKLLAGERVQTPRYDFGRGERQPREKWHSMQLASDDLLVVEGIHGLNGRLTAAIPAERKFRCYVSALTQLAIDDRERTFTSDARLLRRIVRDRRYRSFNAERTIAMWPSVRRGEEKNIFPYQEEADAIFNSALVYEPAILKSFAERFLMEVPTDSPAFVEADRLLRFLGLFIPILPEKVPQNSLLREFIGDSSFAY